MLPFTDDSDFREATKILGAPLNHQCASPDVTFGIDYGFRCAVPIAGETLSTDRLTR